MFGDWLVLGRFRIILVGWFVFVVRSVFFFSVLFGLFICSGRVMRDRE